MRNMKKNLGGVRMKRETEEETVRGKEKRGRECKENREKEMKIKTIKEKEENGYKFMLLILKRAHQITCCQSEKIALPNENTKSLASSAKIYGQICSR